MRADVRQRKQHCRETSLRSRRPAWFQDTDALGGLGRAGQGWAGWAAWPGLNFLHEECDLPASFSDGSTLGQEIVQVFYFSVLHKEDQRGARLLIGNSLGRPFLGADKCHQGCSQILWARELGGPKLCFWTAPTLGCLPLRGTYVVHGTSGQPIGALVY